MNNLKIKIKAYFSSAPSRKTRGFTLIELLVTISIIALLIGILLPALAMAQNAARAASCLSNVRQITIAAHGYALDHNHQWVGWDPNVIDDGTGQTADRKYQLYP